MSKKGTTSKIDTVRVSAYCTLLVGPLQWQGTERYEPAECETAIEAEVPFEDWENGTAMVVCPKCGGELWQRNGDLELIPKKSAEERIYITSLHGLKSEKKFDFETSISNGTHVQVCFVIYNDPGDVEKGYITYETIISNEELFALLRDRCEATFHKPVSYRPPWPT